MKRTIIIISAIFVVSCNQLPLLIDSEIDAIRDQTEVLKEHNKLMEKQNELLAKIVKNTTK